MNRDNICCLNLNIYVDSKMSFNSISWRFFQAQLGLEILPLVIETGRHTSIYDKQMKLSRKRHPSYIYCVHYVSWIEWKWNLFLLLMSSIPGDCIWLFKLFKLWLSFIFITKFSARGNELCAKNPVWEDFQTN